MLAIMKKWLHEESNGVSFVRQGQIRAFQLGGGILRICSFAFKIFLLLFKAGLFN